jgi:tetratricopeptide (TPR) repeat protein
MFPILRKILREILATSSDKSGTRGNGAGKGKQGIDDIAAETIQATMGIALDHHRAGRLLEAETICRQVMQVDPDHPDALHMLGVIAHQARMNELAVELIGKAVRHRPSNPDFLHNLGSAYRELRQLDEALACYDKALAIRPGFIETLNNRGNVLQDLKRYPEALASYEKAVTINPNYAVAHLNIGTCRLLTGDFVRGLPEYEWRWQSEFLLSGRRDFSQPLWLGKESIAGKTILLHAEQGLGDAIQFARYVQAVAREGAKAILEIQPSLKALLSGVAGVHQVVSRGEPLPDFDFHCPLLSLPLAFGTRPETIPATIPYLHASAAKVRRWEERLGRGNVLNVGIAWSGRPEHPNDRNRSMALSKFAALENPDIRLVSLQKEVHPADAKVLEANGGIRHFGPELEDFSDTAALVSLMDLVISVDTSVAHLAGALGKPVWILLPSAPDWRWLTDREDSAWYPTVRLFRQPAPGDWESVIGRVKYELLLVDS